MMDLFLRALKVLKNLARYSESPAIQKDWNLCFKYLNYQPLGCLVNGFIGVLIFCCGTLQFIILTGRAQQLTYDTCFRSTVDICLLMCSYNDIYCISSLF